MSNQLQITGGAKVRSLEGVITGTSGVLSSVPLGGANGVATLDSGGKVPVSQLPSSVVTYLGTWNAATNTPTLTNGTGDAGDMYICNVAGTVNFGAGPITFAVGDWVLYGSGTWQKSNGQNGTVTSVGLTAGGNALTITNSPITTAGNINVGFAGSSTQYIAGDGTLVTFPTLITEAQNLITDVYNETGATLTKGTVVYINGGHGNLPTVTKAIATSDATSAQTYGVVQADITNNNNGHVVVIGSLGDLDTQAYAAGTQLYLSSTTAGAWTSVKQYAPAHLVYVGIVVRSHPTQGVVEVKIQNGFELDELHNVSAQTPSNNQGLFYNSSNSLWENKSIATALGYTPANAATTLTINGTTYDISANRTWNVGTVTGSGSADQVAYWNSASGLTYDSTFYYSSSNKRLGVNTNTPNATIGANIAINAGFGLLVKNGDSNYNGLGIGIDSTYGNLITAQKFGTAAARNITILNQAGYVSLTEAGNFGINILTPTAGPAGVGGTGIDIYGSTTAGLGFHNSASGVGNTNGAYIYLHSTLGFTLRNTEGSITSSSLGDFSVITNSTENFRVNASDGSLWQSNITSSLLKTNSGGVIVPAVAGTDYQTPITNPVSGTGTATRLAFWSASNTLSSNANLYWDNTNARLGIGTASNISNALTIYSLAEASQLKVVGGAAGIIFTEALSAQNYVSIVGIATVANNYITNTTAGDMAIANQTSGKSIFFGIGSTEVMRMTSGGLSITGTKSQLTLTGNSSNGAGITLNNLISGVNRRNWGIFTEQNVDGDFVIKRSDTAGGSALTGTTILSILNTGAATFSSSVQTGSDLTVLGGINMTRGANTWIGTTDNFALTFMTNGVGNRMVISNSGNVGIGTSSPYKLLTITKGVGGTVVGQSELIRIAGTEQTVGNKNEIGFANYANNYNASVAIGAVTTSTSGYLIQDFYIATRDSSSDVAPTERMRITSGGNVGIGTSSPLAPFVVSNGGGIGMETLVTVLPDSSAGSYIQTYNRATSAFVTMGFNASEYRWYLSNTERMRITSGGNVSIGYSNAIAGAPLGVLSSLASQQAISIWNTATSGTRYFMEFSAGASYTAVGSITYNGTLTAYNVTSDYRLKQDFKDYNALSILNNIKTYDFEWKTDKSRMYGVIAHELQEILPYAVVGEKDGEKLQGVDYSKIVPVLVKAIQELSDKVTELENKLK